VFPTSLVGGCSRGRQRSFWHGLSLNVWITYLLFCLSGVSGISTVSTKEFWKHCNTTNYAKFYTILKVQWAEARRDMGMIWDLDEAVGNRSVAKRYEHYLHRFYQFNDGAVTFTIGSENTPVTYLKILKCANEGIRGNLFRLMMLPDGSAPLNGPDSPLSSPQHHKTLKEFREFQSSRAKDFGGSKFRSFTFLRDPFSHFISGFTESSARSFKKPQVIQANVLTNWIIAVLDFKRPLKQIEHFFPMSGVFFTWEPPSFVGHLDAFDEGWAAIRSMYGLPISVDFDKTYDSKVTTGGKDPQNVRTAFKDLQDHVVKAICRIILVDYVCFPEYQMPPQCQSLERERRSAMSFLVEDHPAAAIVWFKSDKFG